MGLDWRFSQFTLTFIGPLPGQRSVLYECNSLVYCVFVGDLAFIMRFNAWKLPWRPCLSLCLHIWDTYLAVSIFESGTQNEPLCEIHWDSESGLSKIFPNIWVRDSIFGQEFMIGLKSEKKIADLRIINCLKLKQRLFSKIWMGMTLNFCKLWKRRTLILPGVLKPYIWQVSMTKVAWSILAHFCLANIHTFISIWEKYHKIWDNFIRLLWIRPRGGIHKTDSNLSAKTVSVKIWSQIGIHKRNLSWE